MTPHTLERALARFLLLGGAFLLAGPAVVQARGLTKGATPPSIALRVSAGYENVYRDTTWMPVHVSLVNPTGGDISGILEIPQSNAAPSVGASAAFHGLYQAPVSLPAGATKQITLYVPGAAVQGEIDVRFDQNGKILATGSAYPTGVDSSALLVGVFAGNPHDYSWIGPAIQQQVTTRIIRLSSATLDPVSQALAGFDLIVLTNADTSQLDSQQLSALEQYVQNGGSLLLVGGPSWQQTLRPLPAPLLPGRLSGMRVVSNLQGLSALGPVPRPTGVQTSAVSVLSQPSGSVLARQAGIPLAVRKIVGGGVVEYLAFDPALNPVQGWTGASRVLGHLVASATPLAISRTWSPQGFRSRFQRAFSSVDLTDELSNLPASSLPLLAIFAALTVVYLLVLGPANFFVLRRVGRQYLAVVTIPVLAASFLGSTFGIAAGLKGSTTLLNSVGIVKLDTAGQASTSAYPATFYVGLQAPLPGDYHVTYGADALPALIPKFNHLNGFFWRTAAPATASPLGVTMQEGNETVMTFPAMQRWSMRDVSLDTTVKIPGSVRSDLRLDARGNIAGRIHNGLTLALLDPVIVAGQTVTRLHDITAGATIPVRVQPNSDTYSGDQSVWSNLYGGPDQGDGDSFFFRRFGCCDQSSLPQERNLSDRVRNAASMLGQVQTLSSLGEVVLVGWSTKSLGAFTVDGSVPQRRDLTLLAVPLTVRFPAHGRFRLSTGTMAAHLVDIAPRAPSSNSSGFFSRGSNQPVSVGIGGSMTFEFDLPDAGRVKFSRLALSLNSSDNNTSAGQVYDWRVRRWIPVDLSSGQADLPRPDRFVSPTGQILLTLRATADSGDITINDPYQDVQISGSGAAS